MRPLSRHLINGALVGFFLFQGSLVPLAGQASQKIEFKGDLRFRMESDWDSLRADGSLQPSRDRARIRARLGILWHLNPALELGLRLRTGSFKSQQSPHWTIRDFDGNSTGDHQILPDQYYLRWHGERSWVWLGRNQWPLWKANELLWDDDVTPAGVAGGRQFGAAGGRLTLQGGIFATPDGGIKFHSVMEAGQVLFVKKLADWEMTSAGSLVNLTGRSDAEYLRSGNGSRDYTVLTGNLYFAYLGWKYPVRLGTDLHQNLQSYSPDSSDLIGARNRDQKTGFTSSIQVGSLKKRGDWLASYTFGRIEMLSVNASYAQDDWARWGSATQTDSSDFTGHELQGAVALSSQINLVTRLFFVDSITTAAESKRFRVDLNYRFP
jgi:hypothetical protein